MATSSVPSSDADIAPGIRRPPRISRRGLLAVLALFAVCVVVAQSCQESQIRIEQEQAIQIARPEAGFEPERTQIRLVRQGLNGRPYWAISFSKLGTDARVTTVRIDANTGKIEAVNREQ